MISSSSLFPVSLMYAEDLGELSEDIYFVKHNSDPDRSVEVGVAHLMLHNKPATLGPVVLVHGSFSNRGFWITRNGIGMARYLLEQGYDVWLMEHRGHGITPRNKDYLNNSVERYVLYDVPAVNEFIQEKTDKKPFWLGHSLGGVMIAAAVAAELLTLENSRGMVLFGTQTIRRPWYLWIPLVATLMRLKVSRKGELDGRQLRIGPENEPAGVIKEFISQNSWFSSWQLKSKALKLIPAWQKANGLPLLAVAGAIDKSDSAQACIKFANKYGGDKDILLLGKTEGFERDYGHVDMVVSKAAAKEVWPKISEWLGKQS